ncbi:MAG: glycosyl transferase [Planctomycetota bacterium]|nr:glycosyl transferase [Planctomycetota bacterium]
MADFFQNGVITTLQDLGRRPLEEMEDEIRRYTERQKLALLLPALYSEFEGPAMPGIIEQLKGADYVHRIILSLDRADEEQLRKAYEAMQELPSQVRFVWHDGPRIQKLYDELRAAEFQIPEGGKGRGVWLSMGYALADKQIETIALHDCDIVNYDRSLLAKLVYPIVHPGTDFEYCKGYYARVNAKLHGRVTRLFFTPLIRSLKHLRGSSRFLDYLDSFRYPLAGEFAFVRSLAKGIRIASDWGLEIATLGEVFENTTVHRVAQAEIAETYEHKHRELSRDDPSAGLVRMATEIAKSLFRALASSGEMLSVSFFHSLFLNYEMQSRQAIEQYNSLALFNGLKYSRHDEIEASEAFVQALKLAMEEFHADPVGEAPLVAWVRVRAAIPDFPKRLAEAVRLDHEDLERVVGLPAGVR